MHTTSEVTLDLDRPVEETLDLEPTPTDAVRFVPVKFREADAAIREPDFRDAFDFSPATFPILFPQSAEAVNVAADCDVLNRPDGADNLEPHARSSYARQPA